MLSNFHKRWREIPIVVIDTETTGTVPGVDGVVQLGIAKFSTDRELLPYVFTTLVNPGRPISAEASAVHGITDAMVQGAPTLADVFATELVRELLKGAQPLAYHAPFDSAFMPPGVFERDWPWFDALTLVRLVDRYARGKGRHKLEAACERHGVKLEKAHDAGHDARAAGELFFRLLDEPNAPKVPEYLGDALKWFEAQRVDEWHRFNDWRARQPPMEAP